MELYPLNEKGDLELSGMETYEIMKTGFVLYKDRCYLIH